MENERWVQVGGFEGLYEVSDHGRVRSLDRVQPAAGERRARSWVGRVLKITLDGDGYPKVALGRAHQRKVHTLVAKAFIPNPENLPEIDHEDTIKANCHYKNLRWCTHGQNSAYRHTKTHKTCEVKFTAAQREKIRAAVLSGTPILHVAREFKVSRAHARRIARPV